MIALIASLLGLDDSVYGPSDCPLCCGRRAAQRTDHSRGRLYASPGAGLSLLRGYPLGNAGNVLMSRSSPSEGRLQRPATIQGASSQRCAAHTPETVGDTRPIGVAPGAL